MRYKAEYVNIKNDDGGVEEDILVVWDNYFDVMLRMDKIQHVNELLESLNIANKVLGDEFEVEYGDRL